MAKIAKPFIATKATTNDLKMFSVETNNFGKSKYVSHCDLDLGSEELWILC